MSEIIAALRRSACTSDGTTAFGDGSASLTRAGLSTRVAHCAVALHALPDTLGLLGDNTIDWVVAQLAGWLAGKTMVPIPSFFSPEQQKHILADCSITHVLATPRLLKQAERLGVVAVPITANAGCDLPEPRPGGGQVIYTSGSTGRPKGVRLTLGQIEHSATMLAEATAADKSDVYFSVLPLPLLLETICAVCVPLLARARTEFDPNLTASIACGQPKGLDSAFRRRAPTTSVLVPELLSVWLAELAASGDWAPASLRFVAIGGAPVATTMAEKAWARGIPVHEGYGLSECCSVVSVNRPGKRRPGTVGQPLPGLRVSIDDGEIVVDGPTVMLGYQSGRDATRPWRTGDMGALDADGYLRILGRRDNLIVTSFGRNVSPEWIEALMCADDRIAACAVLGHGAPHLRAVIIPSHRGATWFASVSEAQVLRELELICRQAPSYAIPRDFVLLDRNEATRRNLLTPNGRFRRAPLAHAFAAIKGAAKAPRDRRRGDDRMSFYETLQTETAPERNAFLSIPLIQTAVKRGASRELYIDFLTQAYHHVKHTFPLLALASVHTRDEAYQDALVEYMEEERGHEKWILDDIRAMGGDDEAVRSGQPGQACQIMVGYTYYAIEWVSPYAMLGSVHVLEGISTMLADMAADAIQSSLAFPGKAGFSYLRSHGALDIEHVAFFRKLVDQLPADAHGVITTTSKIIYRLYADIFRELSLRHPEYRDAA